METITFDLKKIIGAGTVVLAAACLAVGIISYPVSAATRTEKTSESTTEKADKTEKKSVKTDKTDKTVEKKEADKKSEEEETVSFDEALDVLFSESGSMTDSVILKSAKRIRSDGNVLYSELDETTCSDVMAVMDAYEAAKVDYIMAQINGELSSKQKKAEKETEAVAAAGLEMSSKDGVCREWELQSDYTRLMIEENAAIREMIPRFQVTSCKQQKDGVLKLGIDEWMTQGYGTADGKGPENASSYIYSFSVSLKRTAKGVWTPFAINGTEVNFTWLENAEVDPEVETSDAPDSLYEVKSDASSEVTAYAQLVAAAPAAETGLPAGEAGSEPDADGTGKAVVSFAVDESAVVMKAAAAQDNDSIYSADAEPVKTGSLTTKYYSAYDADKAIAYANTYWKHYNRNYTEYRGLDCCNFVSQCLYAGGMPKTDVWFPNSVAWINVPATRRHFSQYGAIITADNTSVRRGNPVYYDWQGDGVYDHTTLCVGTNSSGMPVVDGHTTNVYHVPWRMGSGGKRQTLLLNKNSSSTKKKSTWKTVNGKVYYVDKNGNTVKNKFFTIGGARYYFNKSGVRVTGFFKVNGKVYYASVKNGKLLRGWQWIGGHIYYFSYKNYVRFSGGKYWIGGYTYYFNKNGVRKTGFIWIKGMRYYADKSTGRFVTGWKKISGNWYYFSPSTKAMVTGWRTINGSRCYFNSKGILKKGKHG